MGAVTIHHPRTEETGLLAQEDGLWREEGRTFPRLILSLSELYPRGPELTDMYNTQLVKSQWPSQGLCPEEFICLLPSGLCQTELSARL